MDKQEFIQLLDRYLAGTATEEQVQMVINYYDSFKEVEWDNIIMGDFDERKEAVFARFKEAIESKTKIHYLRRGWIKSPKIRWISAAAAILIIMGMGAYLYIYNNNEIKKLTTVENTNKIEEDIEPGSTKAVLILADGRKIILDSAANGALAKQGNVQVIKLSNGELKYEIPGGGINYNQVNREAIMYNIMQTPKEEHINLFYLMDRLCG